MTVPTWGGRRTRSTIVNRGNVDQYRSIATVRLTSAGFLTSTLHRIMPTEDVVEREQGDEPLDAGPDAELSVHEIWWRDRQKWLEGRGYMLRPRYHPGWVASWRGVDENWWKYEDSTPAAVGSPQTALSCLS